MAIVGSGVLLPADNTISSISDVTEFQDAINSNIETLRQYGIGSGTQVFTYTSYNVSSTLAVPLYGFGIYGVVSAASPGALTITLPPTGSSLTVGTRIKIFDESGNCNTYNITIARNTSQTINGAASNLTLSFNYGHYELIYTATNTWVVIGKLIA